MDTLEHLVNLYIKNMAREENLKLSDFRNRTKPLIEMIKDAVYGQLPNCNQDSHQNQIDRDVLEEMEKRLLDPDVIEELNKCKHFDDIFSIVYRLRISGFGSLCVYDTSLRLGAFFNNYPDVIYLHRGALTGAINLLGKGKLAQKTHYFANDKKFPFIFKSSLPDELQALEAHHIENFLCRFKERILKTKTGHTLK
jgi:hypothetical protein